MKVTFFEVKDWEQEYIKKNLAGDEKNIQLSFFVDPLSQNNVKQAQDADIISCFIDSNLQQAILSQFTDLKMIATRSTGFDHIDMEFCRQKNITVCNVPTYGENTVAEHTFALILDLSRKIHESIEKTKKGDFSLTGLQGFDLKGRTLGVVGLGHIGQHVVRIAKGFEMEVLGFDVNQDKKLAKKLDFTYVSLEELLKNSDIITLHVPYSQHTRHMVNSGNISLVKKEAYIINTARGGLIETGALVKALRNGMLAGAGLDVLEEENAVKEDVSLLSRLFSKKHNLDIVSQDHALMKMDNVIITPHNAFNSREAMERILETTVLNVRGFLKKKAINRVQ